MDILLYEEIKNVTKKLVAIPSINGSDHGEADIGNYLYAYIRDMPYFQEHETYVAKVPIPDDPLGRFSVLALLKGMKGHKKDTIIFHGHMDTVGVDDMGTLKQFAFDCDAFQEAMKKMSFGEDVRRDIESGDYLFGRGSADMKSGDAIWLVLLKRLSAHPEAIDGNIVVMFNPVEENQHTGMITAIPALVRLQKEQDLKYILAINNDYICPLYEGDTTRYVYSGAMGKILPSFYILGQETHVGQCYEGVNAASIAAALIREIDLEPSLCDAYDGEVTLPPVVLKAKDLKPWYNVQTPQEGWVYFSYMVANKDVKTILTSLRDKAAIAVEELLIRQNDQMARYASLAGTSYQPFNKQGHIYTFSELVALAREKGVDAEQICNSAAIDGRREGWDMRNISMEAVRRLAREVTLPRPSVVLFLAPPYLPHNTLHSDIPSEEAVLQDISAIIETVGEKTGETFKLLHFFPSLSDSSYLKVDDTRDSIHSLIHNFPLYEELSYIPFDMIQTLSIPAINYGCYGKDAHKTTERVYMPYSFGVLPQLILETVEHYLS